MVGSSCDPQPSVDYSWIALDDEAPTSVKPRILGIEGYVVSSYQFVIPVLRIKVFRVAQRGIVLDI